MTEYVNGRLNKRLDESTVLALRLILVCGAREIQIPMLWMYMTLYHSLTLPDDQEVLHKNIYEQPH
jgi:hypothetical protein